MNGERGQRMAAVGKYQILKRIAAGGMAELFLAREHGFSGVQKLVVIKKILPQHARNPEYVQMFKDEARIGALLQHPNLVQVYEMGQHEGLAFISMEYLHGEDVRAIYRVLRRRGQPMPLEHALYIGASMAAGLHHAHEQVGLDGRPLNIVHRDVSAQNVIVTFDGGVKVLDFGIAKAERRLSQTQGNAVKGKLSYMAPEQMQGRPIDRRTDVYSLGVLLYELTTGQRPFRGPNEAALMQAVLDQPVTPPQRLLPGYPKTLSAVVLKALSRDVEKRFQSAQELQGALEECAQGLGLRLSSLSLSRFMQELFGDRVKAYQEVLAGLKSVEELPVEGLGAEYSHDMPEPPEADGPVEGTEPAAAIAPAPTALAHFANARLERLGPVTIVRFQGKLDERFAGTALGGALAGTVVFDLDKVERVTSFGVREWMQMLTAAGPRLTGLYLARCPEAVVNQLSLIRTFAGPGRVVSFHAPFACRACAKTFSSLIDVAAHAQLLAQRQLPAVSCPTCERPAQFDDDPRSYLAFGPSAPGPLPEAVRSALAHLAAVEPAAPLEKLIEGSVTRVKVRAALDASLRWHKVLDGVDGELQVDLGEARGVEEAGIGLLVEQLEALGPDVTGVSVVGAPRALAERVSSHARVKVLSVNVEGRCAACASPRTTLVSLDEVRRAVTGGTPLSVACKRCNAPLEAGDLGWLLALAGPMPAPSRKRAGGTTPPARSRRGLVASLAALGLVMLLGALGLAWRSKGTDEATSRAATSDIPASVLPQSLRRTPDRPAWAGAATERTPQGLLVTGHGGPAPSEARALEQAQREALVKLSEALLETLAPEHQALVKAQPAHRRSSADEVASALSARLAHQGLELLEGTLNAAAGGHEVWARFVVSEANLAALEARWRRTEEWRGALLLTAPPELRAGTGGRGLLVAAVRPDSAAMSAGLRPGDMVLELNGTPADALEGFSRAVSALEGQPASVVVDAAGMRRTFRLAEGR